MKILLIIIAIIATLTVVHILTHTHNSIGDIPSGLSQETIKSFDYAK